MKTYDQLSNYQKRLARDKAAEGLLKWILEGVMRFNDRLNHDDLQVRIDDAIAKAEAMQTPWFASEYIMDTCRDEIEAMATCDAEDALFPEPGDKILYIELAPQNHDDDSPNDHRCDQCVAAMINNVYCHETGCPNA